jgi:endoglucanase
LLALLATTPASATPLRRGVNLTNWFRYPPSEDADALASYLSDDAMAALRRTGFDFVRLAVQPSVIRDSRIDILVAAISRLQRHGLAVIVGPHFGGDTEATGLLAFWQRLAPRLAPLDPRMTVAEVMNEPVFPGDASGWAALQRQALAVIRASLPGRRVVLTGNDWGSIAGLRALTPLDDPDAIYSVHFYDPPELTSLAAYRSGLDRAALARLPFPMTACDATTSDAPTRDLIRYICASHWDAAAIDARIAQAASWGATHGVPVLMGEFGASAALNSPARLAWLARSLHFP